MFKFGTSGIRDLTENLRKEKIAAKLAQHLAKQGWQSLSIGRDGRTGSAELMEEFIANFPGTVNNLGVTTTPETCAQPGLAVMITASHNPHIYCGFKIYVNHIEQNTADLAPVPVYQKWAELPQDVVIDCANGGLGYKLKSLGFTKLINTDGEINHDCGATHPENLEKYCQAHHQELGFAVDGDADRVLVYLGDRILSSDETAFLLAKLCHFDRMVIDETANSALGEYFQVVTCAVGGHAVLAAMQENHISFGAEKSGHYYFDRQSSASDAVDAIALIANAHKELGLTGLQDILKEYHPYHQILRNLNLADLPADFETILANLDLPKTIRKVIRRSGTEPLLRIMLEGKDHAQVTQEFDRVMKLLKI